MSAKPQPKNDNLQEHLKKGDTWDGEVFASMQQSRNRAWLMSFFCMSVAVLSLLSLLIVLPLKSYEPYIVTVDKSTGYTEVAKGLQGGALAQDDAITQSNLVRYVSARESYNPSVLRENYEFVALLSDGEALKEFRQLWDGQNPDNPSVRLGRRAAIDIKIRSVSFLNKQTASVRFVREFRENDQTKTGYWNAIIDFQYTQKPLKMSDRFSNPLGFQVTSYRISPEGMESVR